MSQKFQALVKRNANISTQRQPGSLSRTSLNRQKMEQSKQSINKQTSYGGSRQWDSTLSYKKELKSPEQKPCLC